MSLELPVERLNSVRVLDPRVTINDQKNKTYAIFQGGSQNTYIERVSTNFSNTAAVIDCNPPSMQTYINRKIYLKMSFTLTFTGTSSPGNVLLQAPGLPTSTGLATPGNVSYLNAPRNSPIASILANSQITLGNMVISTNLNTYQRAMFRYANFLDQRNYDFSMTPAMLDQHFLYFDPVGSINPIQYSGRNPLGISYATTTGDEGRGQFVGCVVTSNTPTSATVEMTCVEPYWVSPLLYEREMTDVAFIGIQNMQFQLNLAARGGGGIFNGLWSTAADPTLSIITGTSATVDYVSALLNFVTPAITQSIPKTVFYSYYEPTNYQTQSQQILAPGATTVLNFNAIQLNSIPNRCYIFAADRDSNFNYTVADTYLSIQSINVTWENQDGILNAANQNDLYAISVRNQCNDTFRQWSYDVGSVLALQFGVDIALDSLSCPGKRGPGQFNFSFQLTVLNQTNLPVTPNLNCVIWQEGVMSIENNNVIRSVGVIGSQDVLNAIGSGATMPYHIPRSINGGLSWSQIKNFIKNTLPKALRSGLNIAEKIVPAQYKPVLSFADQGLKLIGQGRRGTSRRKVGRPRKRRGGEMMSRNELEGMLGNY